MILDVHLNEHSSLVLYTERKTYANRSISPIGDMLLTQINNKFDPSLLLDIIRQPRRSMTKINQSKQCFVELN